MVISVIWGTFYSGGVFLMSKLESDTGLYVVWLARQYFAQSLFQQICGASQQGSLAEPDLYRYLPLLHRLHLSSWFSRLSKVFLNLFLSVWSVNLFPSVSICFSHLFISCTRCTSDKQQVSLSKVQTWCKWFSCWLCRSTAVWDTCVQAYSELCMSFMKMS